MEHGMAMVRRNAAWLILPALAALPGCAQPGADDRARQWREILAAELPVGGPAGRAPDVLRRHGLEPGRGTYLRIGADGVARSDCTNPKTAITGRDRSAGRGVLARLDVEVTLCVDAAGRIERHVVKIWNQGL
jgi:hypothetical protein